MRWWMLVLLLLPMASAQIDNPDDSFETRLYLHMNGWQEIALNPIAPPAEYIENGFGGLTGHSTCISTPGQAMTGQSQHTWYAAVSPLPVVYGDDMALRTYPHRGISSDLELDAERGLDLTWFMAMGHTKERPDGIAPRTVVEATVREGDALSVGQTAMNAGRIVAEGRTEPADLSPALTGHPQVTVHELDEGHVYEFRLHLPVDGDARIDAEASFNLRVDAYTDNPHCSDRDAYTMADVATIYSSAEHRPTFDLAVRNPVRIDRITTSLDGDVIRLEAHVMAPFGPSDAIFATHAFSIHGPMQTWSLSQPDWSTGPITVFQEGRSYPTLYNHQDSYLLRQAWAFSADAARGDFNATLRVATDSGAQASADVPIHVGDEIRTCTLFGDAEPTCSIEVRGQKDSPALPAAIGLAIMAFLARRRSP